MQTTIRATDELATQVNVFAVEPEDRQNSYNCSRRAQKVSSASWLDFDEPAEQEGWARARLFAMAKPQRTSRLSARPQFWALLQGDRCDRKMKRFPAM
jgi:hypothetical protein